MKTCPDCGKRLKELQTTCICGWTEVVKETKKLCLCGDIIFKEGKCFSCYYPSTSKETKQRLHFKLLELKEKYGLK